MPSIKQVGTKVRYALERLDGGYNTKDSPSRIGPYETPDALNVVFNDRGSAWTRDGTAYLNTQAIGSSPIDGQASYNGSMVAWAGGNMYRASIVTNGAGTGVPSTCTWVTIASAEGRFSSGVKVAHGVYQNILFCSDGTNGPWKYTGPTAFYNMGIATPASAPAASGTSAGSIATGTYYYGVSFVNSQAVEGEIGPITTVAITTSSTIGLVSVPVGTSIQGVDKRRIYRGTQVDGPFRRVGEIANNTTTTYADTTANEAEGTESVEDASSPTPFTTIQLHQEMLFFDDSSNRSLLRWTDPTVPFISQAENFEPIDNGDGEVILAVASQDSFLTAFKYNNNTSIETVDPLDTLTWVKRRSPSNLGIVGPRAFTNTSNGIVFVGRQNNKLTGLHYLNGSNVVETSDGKLRTLSISEKIEYDLLNLIPDSAWANMAIGNFKNQLYIAYASEQTRNTKIFWLDLNRIGTEGQPGSWAPWDGIEVTGFCIHDGHLYAGGSASDGRVYRLNVGAYNDVGAAIDSYYWTKEIGGESDASLDSYIKDFRAVYIWQEKLGNFNMSVRWRVDGDTGSGNGQDISLAGGGSTWGSMVWGVDPWGGTRRDFSTRIPIGKLKGNRIQFRFDNQNTANQAFKVHRMEVDMNLRRNK